MIINSVNNWNIASTGSVKIRKQEKIESPSFSDGFSLSSSSETLESDRISDFLKKIQTSGVKEITENTEKTVPEGNIFSLNETGITKIPRLPDGGYLVEKDTGTIAYYGPAAKKFLETTKYFDKETEVIIPSNGSLKVSVDGQSLSFSETGAVLLGAGSKASVEVTEGDPLVLTTEKAPSWYKKFLPEGDHRDCFKQITGINKHLFACHTQKNRFKGEDLQKLLSEGIVKDTGDNSGHVQWDHFPTEQELKERLEKAGFSEASREELPQIWFQTIRRKLQSMESGHMDKKDFSPHTLKKLTDSKIVRQFLLADDQFFWSSYLTDEELSGELNKAGIYGQEADEVFRVWKKTTKSGYDNTGLIWDKGKVVAYVLSNKINIWNEQNTEWVVNSTAYAGENAPFVVGVSNVKAKKEYKEPVAFKELRQGEVLHRHPVRDDRKQTEGYLVTDGEAALLTIREGKPHISILKAGDMAVIEPGVAHCVLAVNGPYEHLVFQVPSSFQYGFLFKDTKNYSDYSLNEKEILDVALSKLKDGEKGDSEITLQDIEKVRHKEEDLGYLLSPFS